MTQFHAPDPGFDPRVADWLEGYPDQAPSQILESVLGAVSSVPQRRTLRRSWRLAPVGRVAYLGAAIAVAVGTVVAGSQILRPGPAAVQPTASSSSAPTLAPTATPTPSPTLRPLAGNGLIAVTRDDGILLLDANTGKTVKRLEPPGPFVTSLSWAPDGNRLAFNIEVDPDADPAQDPSRGGVWVMDVSTGGSNQLIPCGTGPDACSVAWSPDGSTIAATHGNVLELIDPDSGDATVLQDFRQWAFHPSWSPDSARIAVGLRDGELTAVDRDGSGRTTLSRLPDLGGATWSPDGSTFVYLPGTEAQCPEASSLGTYPSLGWSPDGTRLALVLPKADWGLFVMNADGSDLRLLSDGWASSVAWQPVP